MSQSRIDSIRRSAAQDRECDHPVCQALRCGDLDAVKAFVVSMFEYEPSDKELKWLCEKWDGRKNRWVLSTGPAMWIKNRLHESGCFRTELNPPSDFDGLATAVLHVFFVSLEETAEMLEILHNEDKAKAVQSKVARSKLFGSPLVVNPVDRNAYRVATNRNIKRKEA